MNKKITAVVATALLGISSVASADAPAAPSIYDNGPASARLNMTDMRETEKMAFSLYEALMQSKEAQIYVGGCTPSSATFTAYIDENENDLIVAETNGLKLVSDAKNPLPGFGQNIDVMQPSNSKNLLNGKSIINLKGRYTYNNKNNLMVNERTSLEATGQRGRADKFRSSVIKDFYRGDTFGGGDFYEIFDYGLQVLSKNGYPVNKYWQRSKAIRDNGDQGCTVFVKDRLVGTTACRITVSTVGYSQPDYFHQTGTIEVERVNPDTVSSKMNSCHL